MTRFEDLAGRTFGRLTVLHRGEVARSGLSDQYQDKTFWVCRCTCGTVKTVNRTNLQRNTRSCGCLRKELAADRARDRAAGPERERWPCGKVKPLRRS